MGRQGGLAQGALVEDHGLWIVWLGAGRSRTCTEIALRGILSPLRLGFGISIELSGCPLWVKSGHSVTSALCLICLPHRTLRGAIESGGFVNRYMPLFAGLILSKKRESTKVRKLYPILYPPYSRLHALFSSGAFCTCDKRPWYIRVSTTETWPRG